MLNEIAIQNHMNRISNNLKIDPNDLKNFFNETKEIRL